MAKKSNNLPTQDEDEQQAPIRKEGTADAFPADFFSQAYQNRSGTTKAGGTQTQSTRGSMAKRERNATAKAVKQKEVEKKVISGVLKDNDFMYDDDLESILDAAPSLLGEYGEEMARAALAASDRVGIDLELDTMMADGDLDQARHRLAQMDFPESRLVALLAPGITALRQSRGDAAQASTKVIAGSDPETIPQAFDKFLASKAALDVVKYGNRSRRLSMHTPSNSPNGVDAIINVLQAPEVRASIRAETLARFALYVQSGHAAADLSGNHATKSIKDVVKVINMVKENKSVHPLELARVFELRFREVFVQCKLKRSSRRLQDVNEQQGQAMQQWAIDAAAGAANHQGPGMVDAVIRNHTDPSKIFVAIVTSDKDFIRSRDQLGRHVAAVTWAISSGQPPFKAGDSIQSIQAYSVPLIPDAGRSELKDELKAAYLSAGMEFDAKDADFFNLLPLFSLLGANCAQGLDPNIVLQTRHRRYGASNTEFTNRDELDQAAEVMRYLAVHGERLARAAQHIRLSKPGDDLARKSFMAPMQMFMESLNGLRTAYAMVADDDDEVTDEHRSTAKIVREGLKSLKPHIQEIMEAGSIQAGPVEFVSMASSLLKEIDRSWDAKSYKTKNPLLNGISVFAQSREQARLMEEREVGIRSRQQKMIEHIDQSLESRGLEKSTIKSMSGIGRAFALAAGRLSDEQLQVLLDNEVGMHLSSANGRMMKHPRQQPVDVLFANPREICEASAEMKKAGEASHSAECPSYGARQKRATSRKSRMS